FCGYLHRTRSGRSAGCWLREGSGHCCVEGRIAFDFLHHLMDMSVEYRNGSEAFEVFEGLLVVFCPPSPIGINAPQGNVSEHHDWSAGRNSTQIILEPCDLFIAELAHAFELYDVYQSNEMHAFVIEAVPASAFRSLPISVQKLLAIIDRRVVLARHIENLLRLGALEHLVHGVELGGLGLMAQVAGVDDEIRLLRQSIDAVHGSLQGRHDIGVGRLVETHVAVADLDEVQSRSTSLAVLAAFEEVRGGNSFGGDGPQQSGAGPCHAFQKASTIETVGAVALIKKIRIRFVASVRHRLLCDQGFREREPRGLELYSLEGEQSWEEKFCCGQFVGLGPAGYGTSPLEPVRWQGE